MERIIGQLFTGFMCRVYAAGFALWMVYEAGGFLLRSFGSIAASF